MISYTLLCQISSTRSASQESGETPAALAHSRECNKEIIYAFPNYVLMGKFEATAVGQTHGISYGETDGE